MSTITSLAGKESIRPRKKWADVLCYGLIKLLAICSVFCLLVVILVITGESVPFFVRINIFDFLFGTDWMPVDYGVEMSFGIGNFVSATLLVSCLGLIFAFIVSLFASLFLSSLEHSALRELLCAGVDLLAGVPSVIYGFVGLVVLVQLFLDAGHPSGSCVLAASFVLAVMLLPFMVSSFSESMRKIKERYYLDSVNLGVGKWHLLVCIVLPQSLPNLLPAILRAFARGIGETMAVMMVVGNANLFPVLLGKAETIASLIALEMGSAEANSLHSSALFAAGLVLVAIVFIVNALTMTVSRKSASQTHSEKTKSKSTSVNLPFAFSSKFFERVIQLLAIVGIALVMALILFIFGYCFVNGYSLISWDYLTASPSGVILGEEGGIFPAIVGSLMFVIVAVVVSFPLSCAFALYVVFFCNNKRVSSVYSHIFGACSGIPSIVLGLFVYAVLVRSFGFGRCVFSGGVALALMILPFMEVRFEGSFKEVSKEMIMSSLNLGCSLTYTIRKIVLPACAGEILSTLALGASFAMGACAPLIFTGGVAFAPASTDIFSPAMALPLHLYLMLAQQTTISEVYATAFVMMAIVFMVNGAVALASVKGKRKWRP